MNILFVHQSFPGQFRHTIRALATQSNHRILGLGVNQLFEPLPDSVTYIRYGLGRGNTPGLSPLLLDVDTKLIRGQSCAFAASQLKQKGFTPDLIYAHSGWGEALFLKDVWPKTPLLCYQEFFYSALGLDYDFDSEIQGTRQWDDCAELRMKNANPLLMLHSSDWNITPTSFQRSTFPPEYQNRISVIHDGIDTQACSPGNNNKVLALSNGISLFPSDTVITFVNRRIEPYRGCHIFFRAIPEIQRLNPGAHIVIVGATEGVSYGNSAPGDSWKDYFLKEIEGEFNSDFVHFTGPLNYGPFLELLKISDCHVYLTYPFVLSWSLLEAMSISLPIVGSATPPVQEVITHGHNGLLVDFFSPNELTEAVTTILHDDSISHRLGVNARETILDTYSLENCVPRQLSLMQLVSARDLF